MPSSLLVIKVSHFTLQSKNDVWVLWEVFSSIQQLEFKIWAFWPDLDLKVGFWALGLGFGLKGWDLGLEADIWALRQIFKPVGWDLGLKDGIWASRMGFGR